MSNTIKLAICTNERLTAVSCGARGADELATNLERFLQQHGYTLPLQRVGCLGRCQQGPNLRIAPEGIFIRLQSEADFPSLLPHLNRLPRKE